MHDSETGAGYWSNGSEGYVPGPDDFDGEIDNEDDEEIEEEYLDSDFIYD